MVESPLDARTTAMGRIEYFLTQLGEPDAALLFHTLVLAGWTRDKARGVLQKARWWLD